MEFSIRSLEFPQVVDLIADLAESRLGREEIRNLRPGRSLAELERDFEGIEEALSFLYRFPKLSVPDVDLDRQVKSCDEIYSLLKFLELVEEVGYLPIRKGGELDQLINRLNPLQGLMTELKNVFDDSGSIRDSASTELTRIRKMIDKVRDRLISLLGDIIKRKNRILNNDQIMTRSGRFVLCVRQELRKEMKGVVHDISDSGHSVFIEPEKTIDDQNHLEELRIKERKEIERIIRRLSQEVFACRDSIEIDINIIVRLDSILARARHAKNTNSLRPHLNNEGNIKIKSGRHPVLQEVKRDEVVPLDLQFDSGILVVTGPNAGGKTVLLKTIGLLTLMANSGIFIPAEYGTDLPIIDALYAKIGDDQSIESDLSSFSAQIEIVKRILGEATPNSLVLLDELGSNTSPAEGSALACAILEEILKIGSRCIATTHSEDLKTFVFNRDGFQIGAMGYNGRPTYCFHADYFAPSCAFNIAEKMGLSDRILNRAKNLVDSNKGRFEELTARLSNEINEVERKRREIELELADLSKTKERYEARLREIEDWKKGQKQNYDRQLKKILRDARHEVEKLIEKLSTEGPKKDLIKDIRARIAALKPKEIIESMKDFPVGTMVEVNGEPGQIVDRRKDKYLVVLGRIRCWVHGSQLKEVRKTADSPSLHLRGKRRDEVAYLIDKFIDEGVADGEKILRIVHGKGRGVIKQEVDSFLRKDKRVKDFSIDPENPGQMIVRLDG